MKPIAVVCFSDIEQPGYLATFLDRSGLPWKLVRADLGEAIPDTATLSGLALMGGSMSVNDELPWMSSVLTSVRKAMQADVPVIGHCLGAQVMACALGGRVTDNKCREMGWHPVKVTESAEARDWFGPVTSFAAFQWHYQTFSLPRGAVRVLGNGWCENQAFALGPHIGFQCHMEITEDMVQAWSERNRDLLALAPQVPSIQSHETLLAETPWRLERLRHVADGVYQRWIEGLKR
jgi:GMP synthase-like glutamine amidotransferase